MQYVNKILVCHSLEFTEGMIKQSWPSNASIFQWRANVFIWFALFSSRLTFRIHKSAKRCIFLVACHFFKEAVAKVRCRRRKGYATDAFESPKPEFSVLHPTQAATEMSAGNSRALRRIVLNLAFQSVVRCPGSLSAVQLFLGSIGNCASFTEARFAPARSSNSPRKDIPRSHIETLDWK